MNTITSIAIKPYNYVNSLVARASYTTFRYTYLGLALLNAHGIIDGLEFVLNCIDRIQNIAAYYLRKLTPSLHHIPYFTAEHLSSSTPNLSNLTPQAARFFAPYFSMDNWEIDPKGFENTNIEPPEHSPFANNHKINSGDVSKGRAIFLEALEDLEKNGREFSCKDDYASTPQTKGSLQSAIIKALDSNSPITSQHRALVWLAKLLSEKKETYSALPKEDQEKAKKNYLDIASTIISQIGLAENHCPLRQASLYYSLFIDHAVPYLIEKGLIKPSTAGMGLGSLPSTLTIALLSYRNLCFEQACAPFEMRESTMQVQELRLQHGKSFGIENTVSQASLGRAFSRFYPIRAERVFRMMNRLYTTPILVETLSSFINPQKQGQVDSFSPFAAINFESFRSCFTKLLKKDLPDADPNAIAFDPDTCLLQPFALLYLLHKLKIIRPKTTPFFLPPAPAFTRP